MKKFFLLNVLIGFLFGCAKEKSDVDQATNIRGGRCLLTRNSSDYLCIDFNSNAEPSATQTACNTEVARYPSSGIVNGQDYMTGSNNTCDTKATGTKVGKCTRTDGVIIYYSSGFSAGSSQTDCTSIHNGTWATP